MSGHGDEGRDSEREEGMWSVGKARYNRVLKLSLRAGKRRKRKEEGGERGLGVRNEVGPGWTGRSLEQRTLELGGGGVGVGGSNLSLSWDVLFIASVTLA